MEMAISKGGISMLTGARINTLIASRQLQKKDVAEKAGLTATQLWGITSGRRKISAAEALSLAHALGISISELFGED